MVMKGQDRVLFSYNEICRCWLLIELGQVPGFGHQVFPLVWRCLSQGVKGDEEPIHSLLGLLDRRRHERAFVALPDMGIAAGDQLLQRLAGPPLILLNASTAMDGLSGNGSASPAPPNSDRSTDFAMVAAPAGYKCFNRSGDVLQAERPSSSKCRSSRPCTGHAPIEKHRCHRADTPPGAEPPRLRVTVQISPIGDRVADVDPNPEADWSIRGMIAIMDRNLLLYLDGAAHRSVDAIEHDEQRIAPVWTILPPCSSIAGSITLKRSDRSRWSVPASSRPIRRL